MDEYVDAFLLATVLSESGTEGRGGGALVDDAAGVVVLDPVRPVVLLNAIGANGISGHSPTEALVAPPLVSHGFGGDGADMSDNAPPHQVVERWPIVAVERSAGDVEDGWPTDVKGLGSADPACRSDFAGFAGVRRMTVLFDKNNEQNRALQKERKGYQDWKGRRERREQACDDGVAIARAAAGLSQTDGTLASVSGTVLGKHMPRESSPLNTCAARTPPLFGVLCQIGCSVRNDSEPTSVPASSPRRLPLPSATTFGVSSALPLLIETTCHSLWSSCRLALTRPPYTEV